MNRKMILMPFLLAIFFITTGFAGVLHAGENNPCSMKNPCGANPCAIKNPCAAKKGTANPCAMKPKQIRKNPVKDNAMLQKKGEELWTSTKLGASGLSCGTCHPNGAKLKKEPFPKYIKMADDILTLDQMINFCMMNPMKGKTLQWNSLEMSALGVYVKDHAAGESEAANPCAMKNPCGKN